MDITEESKSLVITSMINMLTRWVQQEFSYNNVGRGVTVLVYMKPKGDDPQGFLIIKLVMDAVDGRGLRLIDRVVDVYAPMITYAMAIQELIEALRADNH